MHIETEFATLAKRIQRDPIRLHSVNSVRTRIFKMTLFEKIIAREVPARIVYEDEHCVAFNDIAPKAPIHVLIVPRKPIPRVGEVEEGDRAALGALLVAARKVAAQLGVNSADTGFRLVINNGRDSGEAVPHLHVHLLAGRALDWPPG